MNTRQLARQLKKHHAESRSWQKTAEAFPPLTKAMAHGIAERGKDPTDPELRKALGLGPRPCPTCKRKITAPRKVKPKAISAMSIKELSYCLEHREPITL